MNLLTKQDLETMAANNDPTPLRLHFESEECQPRLATARQIIWLINSMVDHEYDLTRNTKVCREFEEETWERAYICTDADYQLEQSGNL